MKKPGFLGTLTAVSVAAVFIACSEAPTTSSGPDVVRPDVGMLSTGEIIVVEPKPDEPTKDPLNQCPTPFSLASAKGTEAEDTNEDSWICDMQTPSGERVVIDNNIPPDQIGECPEHFTLVKITEETKAKDRNTNFLVCLLESANGNAVIDDNHKAKS